MELLHFVCFRIARREFEKQPSIINLPSKFAPAIGSAIFPCIRRTIFPAAFPILNRSKCGVTRWTLGVCKNMRRQSPMPAIQSKWKAAEKGVLR